MRYIWESARVKLLVAAVVAVGVVVAGIALVRSSAPSTNVSTARSASASPASAPAYHPLRVLPPQTSVQWTADETMQQSSSSQDVAALEAATFPAPAISASFPVIGSADSSSPSMYALAFTQELLDINFATSTRNELLAWSGYNNAPFTLVEMPASAQVKVLAEGLKPRWGQPQPARGSMPPYAVASGDSERGAAVFKRACACCHGDHGQGDDAGAINNRAFLALISDQALRRYAITGRPDLGMPDYAGKDDRPEDFEPLSAGEIDDLVALLARWREGGPANGQ